MQKGDNFSNITSNNDNKSRQTTFSQSPAKIPMNFIELKEIEEEVLMMHASQMSETEIQSKTEEEVFEKGK